MNLARLSILIVCFLMLAGAAAASAEGPATLPEALDAASARGTLVLVDFFSDT